MIYTGILPDAVWVSIYFNTAVIVLMVGTLVLYNRIRRHDLKEKTMFTWMAVLLILAAVSYILETAMKEEVFVLPGRIMLFEAALHDIILNGFCLLWVLYANYRMYHKMDYIKRKINLYLAPFNILLLLNFINLFVPVFQYYGEDGQIHDTPIYIVQDIVRYAYMIASGVLLYRHKKQGNNLRFFSLPPFIAPAVIGAAVHDLTPWPFQTLALGMAIGLALLYAQIANEQSFCDQETGFFNRYYVGYIAELIEYKQFDLGSIMLFDVGEAEAIHDFSKLLKKQLPKDCEPIRIKSNEIIVLSSVYEKAPLFMVAEDVRMELEEYNTTHNKPMDVKIFYQLIRKNESGMKFLDRMIKQLR